MAIVYRLRIQRNLLLRIRQRGTSMKKGFTLMEMLAVVLLLALVVSFAAPVYRSIRFDVRNSQAKTAAKKLAEAVKQYYKDSRGARLSRCFTPGTEAGNAVVRAAANTCNSPGAIGQPATTIEENQKTAVDQLFACGYLSYKDFIDLPYTFCTAKTGDASSLADPQDLWGGYFALAFSADQNAVGSKYTTQKGFIFVDGRMSARDTYVD